MRGLGDPEEETYSGNVGGEGDGPVPYYDVPYSGVSDEAPVRMHSEVAEIENSRAFSTARSDGGLKGYLRQLDRRATLEHYGGYDTTMCTGDESTPMFGMKIDVDEPAKPARSLATDVPREIVKCVDAIHKSYTAIQKLAKGKKTWFFDEKRNPGIHSLLRSLGEAFNRHNMPVGNWTRSNIAEDLATRVEFSSKSLRTHIAASMEIK